MKRTTYQVPELRDENDNIIQEGTFGKHSAFSNATNDGAFDYILNNLEALRDNINGSRIYVKNKDALTTPGDISAMYIAEDTGKWYLWDGTKYIETDNARKIADEAIAARDAAKASANDAANSAREQQADWAVTDTTSQAFVKNKPKVYPGANKIDPQLTPSNRVTTMNTSYGDSCLRYFNATSDIVDGTKEIDDAHIIQLSWDNGKACDSQIAVLTGSSNMYIRTQDNNWTTPGWLPWKRMYGSGDTVDRSTADAAGNNIQTTYAKKSDLTNYLPLSGGTLTGVVNGVTPPNGDNSTKIATTEFVAKSIAALAEKVAALNYSNAGAHNSIYRGKYLGDHVTDEQYDAIDAGTFEGLFIGDYWVINGVNWRIAAFDYWLHCGDTECTTHHVVIVPDTNLATCQMNNSNVTTGAYIGSNYYTGANSNTGKATANTAINNAFGSSHILTHREHLQNAVTNGYESGGTWYDSKFELMTERMVYGCDIFHNTMNGTNIPNWYSIDKSQLPLFALEPSRITNRAAWWLRGVVSATNFACVHADGNAANYSASASVGVRPAFAIKK